MRDTVEEKYDVRSVTYYSIDHTCSLNPVSFGNLGRDIYPIMLVTGDQYTTTDLSCYLKTGKLTTGLLRQQKFLLHEYECI